LELRTGQVEVASDPCHGTLDLTIELGLHEKDLLLDLQAVAVDIARYLRISQVECATNAGGDEKHVGELGLVLHEQISADLKPLHDEPAAQFGSTQVELAANVSPCKFYGDELSPVVQEQILAYLNPVHVEPAAHF